MLKFMLAIKDTETREKLAKFLSDRFKDSMIYLARDGSEAMQKLERDFPNLLLIDQDIGGRSAEQVVQSIYSSPLQQDVQTIVIGVNANIEAFEDHIVTGKLQFVLGSSGMDPLVAAIYNGVSKLQPDNKEFILKYLLKGEVLLEQGTVGEHLYILKKGKLSAILGSKDKPTVLGQISPGEFVGEMAYINGEPRSATVIADEDSELVEFKINTFEKVIYQKPTWMKRLLQTMSGRIKRLNVFKQGLK